jgi:rRNA maturation protein Nop10
MPIQNTVQEACPVCGKETTLDATEPHPAHPEIELRTYRCADCGPVKTISVPSRPGSLPRAA